MTIPRVILCQLLVLAKFGCHLINGRHVGKEIFNDIFKKNVELENK
jgi:hypothetical protein